MQCANGCCRRLLKSSLFSLVARRLWSLPMSDRSRRPCRYANQLPPQVEAQIVGFKNSKPHWGARKIRELLIRKMPSKIKVPSRSTIPAVLDRNGLVKRLGRRRNKAHGTWMTGRVFVGAVLFGAVSLSGLAGQATAIAASDNSPRYCRNCCARYHFIKQALALAQRSSIAGRAL